MSMSVDGDERLDEPAFQRSVRGVVCCVPCSVCCVLCVVFCVLCVCVLCARV